MLGACAGTPLELALLGTASPQEYEHSSTTPNNHNGPEWSLAESRPETVNEGIAPTAHS